MIEIEKLLYEEKRLLLLYRQMLKKEYDINNIERYENTNELQNHVEMQQAIYLAYQLLWTNQYSFFWSSFGPKSFDLENILNNLDTKRKQILDYYSIFDDNIYSHSTMNQLMLFYDNFKVQNLEKFIKLTYDIIEEDKGIELLANLLFIATNQLPGASFDVVNQELQRLRPIFNNNNLNKFAYRCLEEYNLISLESKLLGKVKRIER